METRTLDSFEAFEHVYSDLTKRIYGSAKQLGPILNQKAVRFIVQYDADKEACGCCIYFSETRMQHLERPVVCFGYFESRNNPTGAIQMLKYVDALRAPNDKIFGPINGSTWDSYRLATNNFGPCFPLDISHPDYYPDLLEEAGWTQARGYATHVTRDFAESATRLAKDQDALRKMKLSVRLIDLDNFAAELDQVYELCVKAFVKSFLFSPIERETFKQKYLALRAYLQAEYVLMAVDATGDLKGFAFAICFPDGNGKKAFLIKTVARDLARSYAGLGGILTRLINSQAHKDGCGFGVHAFMEQDNVSQTVSKRHSGSAFKSYALYSKGDVNQEL